MTTIDRPSFVGLALSIALGPAAAGAPAEADLATFDAVWSTIDRSFYDDDKHGVDWDEARAWYRPLVREADSGPAVRDLLQQMLAELKASHLTIVDGPVYQGMRNELLGRPSLTFGVQLEQTLPDRYFVRALYEGGPAEAAGLRLGDRVVAIDGVPIADSPRLVDAGYDPGLPGPGLYFVAVPDRGEIALEVQSHEDAATRRTLRVSPRSMSAVDAAANSVRVVESGGVRIGTLHLWYCSRGVADVLEEAVAGPLSDCDALVLDIRGRGGYSDVVTEILAVFRPQRRLLGRTRAGAPPWSKPLVVLIDERSRSAKEILSYRIRRDGIGLLVGQRTEGAVLGAMFKALPDGSYLEYPGMAVPVGGVSLEGVGVAPDFEVDQALPYARGRDAIFEKGVQVAVDEVVRRRAERDARPRRSA